MIRILIVLASLLVALLAVEPAAQADGPVCPDGTHAIYTAEGVLVSCEEVVGSPDSCPEDALPGYLEDGTLAGCFTASLETEELCTPIGVDTDEDGLDDGCDPCPENMDCDADGFSDSGELWIGTDPLDACPDDRDDAAWPPDIDNNAKINVLDIVKFRGPLIGARADGAYDARFDLKTDHRINILDIVVYRRFFRTTCDALQGDVSALGGMWCWNCVSIPSEKTDLHVWGEFRWTIPFPWPIPDLVRVVYRMDLRSTFVWIEALNAVNALERSASA